MTEDSHVDGNALGGLLHDIFGREMTDQIGCCSQCGAVGPLGALLVYRQGPGDVLRCNGCGTVLVVAVMRDDRLRVTFESLRWLEVHPTETA